MLFWYWLCGAIGGFVWGAVYTWYMGYAWYPVENTAMGVGVSTFIYFVQTLGAGLENAYRYKTLRVYALWDATLFLAVFLIVFLGYSAPRDIAPAVRATMSSPPDDSPYLHGFYIFLPVYFVTWLVLRKLFKPSVTGINPNAL